MTTRQFRLPDLGEGLTEGEILRWLVEVGDTVRLDQPIVEVETAKAAVEVPSPHAGVVTALHYPEGSTVDVGEPIISFETGPAVGAGAAADERVAGLQAAGAAANSAESSSAAVRQAVTGPGAVAELVPAALAANPPSDGAVEPGLIGGAAPGGRTSVLVGYGPRSTAPRRRPRRDPPSSPAGLPDPPPPSRVSAVAVGELASRAAATVTVLAKPPVRKLARQLGVDLSVLRGSGPGGVVTRADVELAAETIAAGAAPSPVAGGSAAGGPVADAVGSAAPGTARADGRAGVAMSVSSTPAEGSSALHPAAVAAPAARAGAQPDQRLPVRGVRRATAAAMVASAFTAPHVTVFLTVDVTPAMELRSRLGVLPEFDGLRVTPLLLVAKALLLAVRRHPMLNSSWDEAAQEIVVHGGVNLGIAAATPRGLVVPNVKGADRLTLPELAQALGTLVTTAREGRTPPADMQGGTITITNVGTFGVDSGTPILNPGEAAILCLGAVRQQPWVHEGALAVRQVTQLSLSFDHRIVDGQLGSQFLADVGRVLADPTVALAWV